MVCKEVNPAGQFDFWEPLIRNELKEMKIDDAIGQTLLFENRNIKIWEIVLFPKERLSFRRITNDYSFVSVTEGSAIARSVCGKICFIKFKKNDTQFVPSYGVEKIHDLENIGENLLFFHVMEMKPLLDKLT